MPAGATCKRPVTLDEGTLRLPKSDWTLVDTGQLDALRLATPRADHSVLLLWPEGHGGNREEPLRHRAGGFDYLDQTLEIVIRHWKDEDVLADAVSIGLISGRRAKELGAEGERVVELMKAREPPFDGGWESWRPEEAWPVLELSSGCDEL